MRLLIAISALALAASVPAASASPAKKVLRGTVGPGFVITLKNSAGQIVKTAKAGEYILVVQDKSAIHEFHLVGPGINKNFTSLAFRGTKTFTIKVRPGRYIYQCDPHTPDMKASVKVIR
ncbi:MAG TPA: hypothetical protein VFR32_04720 [Gaiellaceae bacterium]|nr:hypothetical protein [Gaiellaceae bacterium]